MVALMARETDINENLQAVRASIADASAAAGRRPDTVTLVAVSKAHPVATIRPALEAGQRVFGENRVQEAEGKWPGLKADYPDATLHLIGPLQRNKVRHAVQLFDVIETVDRLKLARAIAAEIKQSGKSPLCFVQVNTGEEPQKSGVAPEEADAFIGECRDGLGLPIEGLMCLPPQDEEPSLHFALLGEIARRNGLEALSMGMSADFETAIRFGASHVRIWTAVFGPRPAAKQGPGGKVNPAAVPD